MANTKRLEGVATSGLTLYFTVWNNTGLFCDNADGDFRFPPASYLLPATEIGATGVYYRDENRFAWTDGVYNYILVDAGGTIYATGGQIEIVDDSEVDSSTITIFLNTIWDMLISAFSSVFKIFK